jgi:hypothetical protein
MKKLYAPLLALVLALCAALPASSQVPPGLMRFGTTGVFPPQVGDCLSIMAMNSSGQVATDAGIPCLQSSLATAYTNATTAYTAIMALPTLQAPLTVSGECTLIWQSSSTSGTPTFALGNSTAPTDLWVIAAPSDGVYVVPTYTTITATTTTAVTGALVTTTANTAYLVRLAFTLVNPTAADTLTVYAESNNASYTISVEPGSYCMYD